MAEPRYLQLNWFATLNSSRPFVFAVDLKQKRDNVELSWVKNTISCPRAIFALLKGTQAWDIFEFFFWPKSNPYTPLVNFRKIFCLVSFDFRQNFEVRTFTQWLSIRGTKFIWEISKIFFFKIFTVALLDGFLDGFSKFWFFCSRNLHFN
jgi:hypothetical protein